MTAPIEVDPRDVTVLELLPRSVRRVRFDGSIWMGGWMSRAGTRAPRRVDVREVEAWELLVSEEPRGAA